MDRTSHLTERQLNRFFRGELGTRESQGIVRHLLTGCHRCRQLSAGRWLHEVAGAPGSPDASGFDRIFDRAASGAIAQSAALSGERAEAPALLAELDRHPAARRDLLVANSKRFQTWGMCECLLEAAFQAGFRDPGRAIELSELALAVAERLPSERYGERLVNDVLARSWGTLGNARRIRSDLVGAERAINRGLELGEHGTGDPIEQARLLSFLASLRGEQRRYEAATRIHDRILRIYKRLGDRHMVGRTLGQKARALRRLGRSEEAVRLSREALENLDRERGPRDVLVVRNGLAHSLVDAGRLSEACAELRDVVRECDEQGNELDSLRCQWKLAQVLLKRERVAEAEQQLRRTRDRFVAAGIPYDAALANLDLAQALFGQGKFAEMKARLSESIPIFKNLGMHQETIAALVFLKRATELEQVTSGLIRATARFVESSRKNPRLRFRADQLGDSG